MQCKPYHSRRETLKTVKHLCFPKKQHMFNSCSREWSKILITGGKRLLRLFILTKYFFPCKER